MAVQSEKTIKTFLKSSDGQVSMSKVRNFSRFFIVMPPKPSATNGSGTSKTTGNDWLELDLPEVKPGEEPLPHREPSFETMMAHARILLPWWREMPLAPKNTEPFRRDRDFPVPPK